MAAGELLGNALFGDAGMLTTGALLGDAAGGGNELGISLVDGVDAAGDAMGALLATDATWCVPEHATSTRHTATATADRPSTRRRAL